MSSQVTISKSAINTSIPQASNANVPPGISTNVAEPSELSKVSVQFSGANWPANPGIKLVIVVVEDPNKPSVDSERNPNTSPGNTSTIALPLVTDPSVKAV